MSPSAESAAFDVDVALADGTRPALEFVSPSQRPLSVSAPLGAESHRRGRHFAPFASSAFSNPSRLLSSLWKSASDPKNSRRLRSPSWFRSIFWNQLGALPAAAVAGLYIAKLVMLKLNRARSVDWPRPNPR